MAYLPFAVSAEVNMSISTTLASVAMSKHKRSQVQEMVNQEQLAIDILPQVVERIFP